MTTAAAPPTPASPPPAASASPATAPASTPPSSQPFTPPPNSSPMMSPDGKLGYVPTEKVSGAIDSGYESAIQVMDPNGRKGFVARSKLDGARQAGFKEITPPSTNLLDTRDSSGAVDPGTISQIINDPTGFHSGVRGQVEKFGQGALQSVNAIVQHPYTSVKTALQLPVDMLLAAGVDPKLAGIEPKEGEAPNQQQQNARARLMDQWNAAKENPAGFIGQQVGGSVLAHAVGDVGGAALAKGKAAVAGAGETLRTSLENATGATEAVRKAGEQAVSDQGKVEEVNANRQKGFQKKVADANQVAQEKTAAANQKVADWNDQQKLAHANKVSEISADNQAEQAAADQANEANKAAAQAKYQENVKLAEDTESERGQLARQEIQTRLRLARRVQQVAQSAKGVVDGQFNVIRKAVGNAQDPIEPLADSVEAAKGLFEGSQEKIRQFQEILRLAKGTGADDDLRQSVMESQGMRGEYDSLPQSHKATVDSVVDAIKQQGGGGEEEEPATISFGNLRGYSSELGRQIHQLRVTNGPGDVIKALNKVKATADAMAQKMANDANVGEKLNTAKKNWQVYMDTFKEPTGPSGSGSPVAKSLNAEDAHNATEPFLSDDPEIASRARRMLVGSPTQGPHFDSGAGKLVDKLRGIRAKVDQLPTNPIDVKPYAEPKPVQPKLKELPEDPKLKPAPEPIRSAKVSAPEMKPDAEPVDIQDAKYEAILNHAHQLKYLSKRQILYTLSMAGGAVAEALRGSPVAAAGLAGGAVLSAVGPQVLGSMIESERFVKWLSKPGEHDLETLGKLKDADKIKVQNTITDQAERLADMKRPIKIDPKVQRWLGPGNMQKIARSIVEGKAGSGTERIVKEEEGGAGVGVGAGGAALGAAAGAEEKKDNKKAEK